MFKKIKTSHMVGPECLQLLQGQNVGRVVSKLFIGIKIRIVLLHGVEKNVTCESTSAILLTS